jgi:AcrR family transcriptional regulator
VARGGEDPRLARSRAAALTAARELLGEQGWAGVTHAAVASRSGVGRTTVYRLWPERAALVRDTLSLGVRDAVARLRLTGRLRADLLAMLAALRGQLRDPVQDRGMRGIIERVAVDPSFAAVKESLFRLGTSSLVDLLTRAKANGELDQELDVEFAVEILVGPVFFRHMLAGRPLSKRYTEQIVDNFLRLYQRDAGAAPTSH